MLVESEHIVLGGEGAQGGVVERARPEGGDWPGPVAAIAHALRAWALAPPACPALDRKRTLLNSSHVVTTYAVFLL